VVRRWVWSRNLVNEEALAHWEVVAPNKGKKILLLLWSVLYERGNRWGRNNLEASSKYTMCNCIPELTNSFPLFPHWRLCGDETRDLSLSRAVSNLESLNRTSETTVSSLPRFPYCSRKCKAGVEPVIHLQRRRWCSPRLGVEAQRPADLKWSLKNFIEWRRSCVLSREEPCGNWRTALTLYVNRQGRDICFVLTIHRRYRCSSDSLLPSSWKFSRSGASKWPALPFVSFWIFIHGVRKIHSFI